MSRTCSCNAGLPRVCIAADPGRTYTDTMDSLPLRDIDVVPTVAPPAARIMGKVNWIGFWTLLLKEVRRFVKVWLQTIAAPVITTLLFYAVFSLAMSGGSGGASQTIY